ncbi:MAG: hypothetical protein E4G99_06215 [Anaerolineales bacterium]|nr:MAG: hypothetical protein E4G99_06215 [Anaerolineales bacterium]
MDRNDNGLMDLGQSILRSLLLLFLGRDVTAALIRFILLAGFVAIHWVITIVGLRFPGEIPIFWLRNFPPFLYPLLNIASTFLNPEILLHLLPVLVGLLLGLLLAARYLSDLFELERFEIAWRYLGAAVFGLTTPTLRIDRGDKESLPANNPIKRIGGPGLIQTHLGYAAVFESIEGIPMIYGLSVAPGGNPQSSDGPAIGTPQASYVIRGFERLRDVVDLRDRIAKVDQIRAETRDGVEVFAQDAQMVFRVFGGDQERSLDNPYPFTQDAIRRIVYGQPVGSTRRRSPTEALKDIVRHEIREFVGRYTLEEFLALQPYRQLEQQEIPSTNTDPTTDARQSIQIPRRELTERFHTPDVHNRLKEQGLDLAWVGVGTWSISEALDLLEGAEGTHTLIQTWRDSQRLLLFRSPEYMQRQRQVAFQQRPNTLLRAWIESWESGELPRAYRCFELLSTIAHQLQSLENRYASDTQGLADFSLLRKHIDSLLDPEVLGSDEP